MLGPYFVRRVSLCHEANHGMASPVSHVRMGQLFWLVRFLLFVFSHFHRDFQIIFVDAEASRI